MLHQTVQRMLVEGSEIVVNEEWGSQIKVSNSVWLIFFQIQQKHYFLKNHIRYRNDSFCVVIRKQNAIFIEKNI